MGLWPLGRLWISCYEMVPTHLPRDLLTLLDLLDDPNVAMRLLALMLSILETGPTVPQMMLHLPSSSRNLVALSVPVLPSSAADALC